jgi:hypothetical protein
MSLSSLNINFLYGGSSMKKQKQTSASIILTVTQEQKQRLRKIAAATNMENPDGNATISSIGREAVEQYLKSKKEETQ